MTNYVISWHDSANHGGSKAKQDVEFFLQNEGAKIIDTPSGKINKILFTYLKFPQEIKNIKNSTIIFQFPSGKPFLRRKMLDSIRKSSNKLIILIHDIECLRLNHEDGREKENQEELNQLKNCDGIISHNASMTNWLRQQGITVPIVNLEIFDYDNPQPINLSTPYEGSICFAGNLAKSSFLNQLKLDHKMILFGSNPAESYHHNLFYKGIFSPNELPKRLTQNFGLVWDGPDVTSCTGPYGEYMQYNDPHKVSLYLSSGLPVIIWKKAALADFIEQNKLGIVIDNLNNLDNVLDRLSKNDYQKMKYNVDKISSGLRQGIYIKNAMTKILRIINKGEK
ncbi:beta-1,6-galactofuranosyltransferase [Limosilactobacillus reuteri]|uniref:beta-1,6-galactofuranosyltransferase n=1 Tax=Limosilactobacillus reuteri TaxID=1598 RepID=UPI001E54FB91|nr:beta-1,6-galactofuranosyltransferase [Limosilactobacillus reuteri]MCC4440542.1 beta-1,6-galactofuranosyltransferase [Limosilactobacillus reuteri]